MCLVKAIKEINPSSAQNLVTSKDIALWSSLAGKSELQQVFLHCSINVFDDQHAPGIVGVCASLEPTLNIGKHEIYLLSLVAEKSVSSRADIDKVLSSKVLTMYDKNNICLHALEESKTISKK
jgi:hypothetical protein